MKIGIGLPTWLGNLVTGPDVLDWARRVEDAGFDAVVVHDRPFHETWDPLAALAVVAPVTSRVRLATGALLLPMRDEALVAKQANVVDLVSGGRLDLGVALGARTEDFALFGRTPAGRGAIFDAQLARLIELWDDAVRSRETGDGAGPASVQRPHPALWVGGYAPRAIERAVTFGDGYVFGAPGVEMMRDRIPAIRASAAAHGKATFPVAGLAYVLPSADPAARDVGERLLKRYYGSLRKPFPELVLHGDRDAIVAGIEAYRAAGLDTLHLVVVSQDPAMIDVLARDVIASA